VPPGTVLHQIGACPNVVRYNGAFSLAATSGTQVNPLNLHDFQKLAWVVH